MGWGVASTSKLQISASPHWSHSAGLSDRRSSVAPQLRIPPDRMSALKIGAALLSSDSPVSVKPETGTR